MRILFYQVKCSARIKMGGGIVRGLQPGNVHHKYFLKCILSASLQVVVTIEPLQLLTNLCEYDFQTMKIHFRPNQGTYW